MKQEILANSGEIPFYKKKYSTEESKIKSHNDEEAKQTTKVISSIFGHSHSCYPLRGQILRFLIPFRQRAQRVLHVHLIVSLQHEHVTRSNVTKSLEIDFI